MTNLQTKKEELNNNLSEDISDLDLHSEVEEVKIGFLKNLVLALENPWEEISKLEKIRLAKAELEKIMFAKAANDDVELAEAA